MVWLLYLGSAGLSRRYSGQRSATMPSRAARGAGTRAARVGRPRHTRNKHEFVLRKINSHPKNGAGQVPGKLRKGTQLAWIDNRRLEHATRRKCLTRSIYLAGIVI